MQKTDWSRRHKVLATLLGFVLFIIFVSTVINEVRKLKRSGKRDVANLNNIC